MRREMEKEREDFTVGLFCLCLFGSAICHFLSNISKIQGSVIYHFLVRSGSVSRSVIKKKAPYHAIGLLVSLFEQTTSHSKYGELFSSNAGASVSSLVL